MPNVESFSDTFDVFNQDLWFIADFPIDEDWIQTAWVAQNVSDSLGNVTLAFSDDDSYGEDYSGAEIRRNQESYYGRYEVTMRPADVEGVISSFFVYTGGPFGDPTSEIDFEFRGDDTSRVLLTYHTPDGSDAEWVDLGFDAAASDHTYAFEWGPDSISWYADDVLLREVTESDIGIPAEIGRVFMNIWTGETNFTGTPPAGASTSATYSSVSYTVWPAPVTLEDHAATAPGEAVAIDVMGNDFDLDSALLPGSLQIVTGPTSGQTSVDPNTGAILYTPNAGFVGLDTFSYTLSEGPETSNVSTVTVAVGDAGFALESDGTAVVSDVADLQLNGAFTIETWVYLDPDASSDLQPGIVRNGDDQGLYFSGGALQLYSKGKGD
ncbi:MAG: family 16 glycosylhydrolase, partial [Rhodobacteraceae bacterium]|nr:family 16 glycosylhydrolase [Paracoccaceae bacterium]